MRRPSLPVAIRCLLGVAIIWNVAAAIFLGDTVTRPLDIIVAVFCTFVLAFTWGREQMLREWKRSIEWLPAQISWHDDDDGVRHAFVTQNSGKIVTIALPAEIDSAGEAMRFLMDVLSEMPR